MRVCYLDLDGVLVDFVGGALKLHGKEIPPKEVQWNFPRQLGFADTLAKEFWDLLGYDFWANLGWTHEGRETLKAVEGAFYDRVCIMTSPCNTPGAVEGKVAWIKREIPDYSRRFVVGPAKHLFAGPGKVLVDDNDDNVEQFRLYGGRAVLVPRPWNHRRHLTDDLGRFDVAKIAEEF